MAARRTIQSALRASDCTAIASSSRIAIAHSSRTAAAFKGDRRLLHTSPPTRKPDPAPPVATASAKTYPYASGAIIRNTPYMPSPNVSRKNPKTRGVMAGLHAQLRRELDPSQRITGYFARNSKTRVRVGSVIIVETYTNSAKTGTATFSGVLLGIRRRGVSTSIIVRNLVAKTGVEVMFNIYSPLLKDIKIVQRADAGKNDRGGRLRRTRRAKLYFLRKDSRRLANIGRAITTHKQQQDASETKKSAAPGLRRLR